MLAGFRGLYGDCPDMGRRRRALRSWMGLVDRGHLRCGRSRHRSGSLTLSLACATLSILTCVFHNDQLIKSRCEMPTQILPAASLRNANRLPATRALVRAAYCLICIALWSIGRAIFGIVSNFLPALRVDASPGRVEEGYESPPRRQSGCIEEFAGLHAPPSIAADAGQPR